MPRQAGIPLQTGLTLGFTMLGAPSALLLLAELHGAGSWVPLLYALLPLVTAFSSGRWSPVLVVPMGAVLVLLNGTVPFTWNQWNQWNQAAWAIPVLGAVGSQAFALRFAATHLHGVSLRGLLGSMALQSVVAAAFLVLGSTLFDPSLRLAWTAIPASLLPALLGTALPYALLYRLLALDEVAPYQAATAQWLQVLIAVLEGAAVARVWPSWQSFAAALAILVCTWIAFQREENTRPTHLFGSAL